MKKIGFLLPSALAFSIAIGAAIASNSSKADASVPLFRYVSGICTPCNTNPSNAMQCTTNNTGPICRCVDPVADAYHEPSPSQCLVVRRPFIED